MLIQLYYYNYIILLLNFSIITFLWKHDFDRTMQNDKASNKHRQN